jgi:hypothetical protein
MSNLEKVTDPTDAIESIFVELSQPKSLDNKYACTINVINGLPSSAGITIHGVCIFAFKNDQDVLDGTYEVDNQEEAKVPSGGTLIFRTKDTSKCVGKYRLGIFADVPGKPDPVGPAEQEKAAPAGNCIVFDEFTIGQKKLLLFSAIKKGESLELVITGTELGNA